VLLLYNIAAPPGVVSIVAARVIRASVFAVIADVQVPGSGLVADTYLRRVEYRLQQWTIPRCDGLIVLTENIAHDFAPEVPHICVEGAIPDALASNDALPTAAASRGFETQPGTTTPLILMYAGGLSELKGIPLLLAAMRQLESRDYLLWITGDGPLRSSVEAAAATDDRVTYWGFAPYPEVLRLMAEATVLINPHSTTHESARYVFPSKLIEYLATGKPVISTVSVPEVKEQYGHVMYVVQEETPEALATQIRYAATLSPYELSLMGTRARSYVLAQKSWSIQGQRIAEFVRGNISR
jgi:glycosyltransferase involved in cell wall biosynthesis